MVGNWEGGGSCRRLRGWGEVVEDKARVGDVVGDYKSVSGGSGRKLGVIVEK